MKNQKCDRQIGKIITSLILGCGLQALFSIPGLAETTEPEPEITANIVNIENPVNEWYQPLSLTNLPDNFENKSVENSRDVDVNSPINPTSEPVVPIVSEIETHISNATETQRPEIPPLDLLQKKYVLSLKDYSSLGQTLDYWVDWHLLKLAQPARL